MNRRNPLLISLRQEIRSSVRQILELRKPIGDFQEAPGSTEAQRRYYVADRPGPRAEVIGLRVGLKALTVPDERREDALYQLAGSVWQLKDRLAAMLRDSGRAPSKAAATRRVNALATDSLELRICSDLTNLKKHRENRNRSNLDPEIGEITYHLEASGVVELYYDGATKQRELLVTIPNPIPVTAGIVSRTGGEKIGEAVETIATGFCAWLPMVREVYGLDDDDKETIALLKEIESVEEEYCETGEA